MATLRDFVADLMERQGAAVEPLEPDGLTVIAPPEIRAALGWPELARLGFGTELPAAAQRIGMESDWLERFGTLLSGHGRSAKSTWMRRRPSATPSDSSIMPSTCPMRSGVSSAGNQPGPAA